MALPYVHITEAPGPCRLRDRREDAGRFDRNTVTRMPSARRNEPARQVRRVAGARRKLLLTLAVAGRSPISTWPVGSYGEVAPLLEPGLVTDAKYLNLQGRVLRSRGVRAWDDQGEPRLHVDVYDGDVVLPPEELPDGLLDQLAEALEGELKGDVEASEEFAAWSRWWRVGRQPALHCQADTLLSIVSELRSGRYLRRLVGVLYEAVRDRQWTRTGINFGASMIDGDDDPIFFWARDLSERVLLVDGKAAGLRAATSKIEEGSATGRTFVAAIEAFVDPLSIESGEIGEVITRFIGDRTDIIKVDIDSFDCAVLRATLRRTEAALIVLESQPIVPPPFKFVRQYSPGYTRSVGLHGCSLSYQIQMLHPEYLLMLYTEHDTIFVHHSLAAALEALPPGYVFPWTTHPLRFPVDEIDCYRRSRSTPHPQGDHPPVPVEFLREWALRLHPHVAFPFVAGNLTTAATDSTGPMYTVDL